MTTSTAANSGFIIFNTARIVFGAERSSLLAYSTRLQFPYEVGLPRLLRVPGRSRIVNRWPAGQKQIHMESDANRSFFRTPFARQLLLPDPFARVEIFADR